MQSKFAFICDYAQQSGGKLHAIGIGWDTLYARAFPTIHPTMSFVAVLTGTIAESGTKNIALRLLDADGADVIPPMQQQLPFEVRPPNLESNLNIVVQLTALEFSKPGGYAIHLIVQEHEMATVSFTIVEPPATA